MTKPITRAELRAWQRLYRRSDQLLAAYRRRPSPRRRAAVFAIGHRLTARAAQRLPALLAWAARRFRV